MWFTANCRGWQKILFHCTQFSKLLIKIREKLKIKPLTIKIVQKFMANVFKKIVNEIFIMITQYYFEFMYIKTIIRHNTK